MMLPLLPLLLMTPVARLHLPSGPDTMVVLLLPPLTVARHRAGVIHLLYTPGMTVPLPVGYRQAGTLLPGAQMCVVRVLVKLCHRYRGICGIVAALVNY